ncbi:MAG: carboxypeptidase regulatory-like domain-containing protein, partial [Actinobacteria bacterium]|nr:carboxypeptidase regulatory-like domain-containing protein [Actinomycetota bacterium]
GGVPEGSFALKAEDPLTAGIATAPVAVELPELPPFEPVNVGTLVLDLEPIRVVTVTPAPGATLVPPDSNVVLTFSDPFAQAQVPGRFFFRSGGANVSGTATVSADGLSLTFDPAPHLPPNALVEVFVSKELPDTFGRKLGADFTSSFATGGAIVTGTVTSQGAPVSGASVVLTNAAGPAPTVTDGAGRYRFENVAVGAASIVASQGGLAGSRVVDVFGATGVVVLDIPIAFVASISGRVFLFDNSPAGAGLEVRVLQSGTAVGLAATGSDGTYQVNDVPLGAFLLDVRNLSTGDRGQRSGTLATGGASGIEVTLTGLAQVRVIVEDANQARISGASVLLSFTRFGGGTVLNGVTGANGEASFGPLLAGSVNIQATDAPTGRTASATTNAAPGIETVVNLALEPTGSIAGTVFAPGGPPSTVAGAVVRVFRESATLLKAETVSASDGTFGFANLPSPQSPYRIDVLVNGRLRARRRAITVPPNGTAVADVELVGLGRVQGSVLPPAGQTLSSLVNVTLTSLAPDVGGIFTVSGASGAYAVDDVPVGAFRVSARDVVKGFLGEAQGVVPANGATVTANVQLLNNAFDFNSAASDL